MLPSALPVLGPGSRRDLDDRAEVFELGHIHLGHERPCARQLPVHGMGARHEQLGHAVQLARLQRRFHGGGELRIDQAAVRFRHGVGGACLAAGLGDGNHFHRLILRMPAPALPVLDPASRIFVAGRAGLLVEQDIHVGHNRLAPRQLPLHGVGPRREQQRDAVQLTGLQ